MSHGSDADRMILASASPRRSDLLAEAGYGFEVIVPPLDEPNEAITALSASQQAEALAYFKAMSIHRDHADRCVLGADTVVEANGRALGKPADRDEARWMLQTLSAGRHKVITGVAILAAPDRRLIASETTHVTMRQMTDRELDDYIASGEWEGKSGAYAIQETADRFVTAVEGSFTNVVGLPMELVDSMLQELRDHPTSHRVMG